MVSAAQKKAVAVSKAKSSDSVIFYQGSLIYFFLYMPSLEFTEIKSAPSNPQTQPMTIAAGISRNEFSES